MTCASQQWNAGQNIKCLYAEAHRLRNIVLRRLSGIGCEIDEKSLPKAQAIVSANIGKLVAAPEYASLLDRRDGESRILALLIQSCAAEIPVTEKRRKATLLGVRLGTRLGLVAENGELR